MARCTAGDHSSKFLMLFAVLLFTCVTNSHGARILGIFPVTSLSHQLPYQAVMKALAARGHQVTVISPDPLKEPVANYTDIDLSASYEFWKSFTFSDMGKLHPADQMGHFNKIFVQLCDMQLSTPQMQEFMKSKDNKFDLIVLEKFFVQTYYGLVHYLGSPPVVAIVSLAGLSPSINSMGNPNNPAYVPNVFAPYSDHMDFWERMSNLYYYLKFEYLWHYEIFPTHEVVMRKHFGSAPPPVHEAEYNDSLLILCNDWSLYYPRPLLPNVIEVPGLHVKNTTKPLPKDIQEFLDGAKHGVIYFSLGGNVRSDKLPPHKLKEIVAALSELPQRVLWKWESDTLPGKPDNVMVKKWLPQQDVLAHPNIRGYIMQGGLQSFQEAAVYGIPLLAVPFMSDQYNNVAKFESSKIGFGIRMNDITKKTLLKAIQKLVNDPSYRDNMKKMSAIYKEQKEHAMDRALWWIEYVIRHNGARHLRSAALDLTWYQYLLLDVIAFIILIVSIFLVTIYIIIKKIIKLVKGKSSSTKLKKS